MGKVAEENKLYGYGILKEGCPDFIKEELITKRLSYSDKDKSKSDSVPLTVDISILSYESKAYLKLKEICKEDKESTLEENAVNLIEFIRRFCKDNKDSLNSVYSFILNKTIHLEKLLSTKNLEQAYLKRIELRAHIKTLEILITGIITNLASTKKV